mmetsp:Transcript_16994/g.47179  ORF Transcript_16994/g.47179 Transcript_16994/m.47179 type:complete len:103 (-) Transcript_16994:476-784(-)
MMASADLSAAQLVTGSLLLHRPIPSVRRYAALIKGTESAGFEAFDLSVIQGSTSHTTPILCVQAEGEAKYPGLPLLRSASRLYQDTLRQVLDKFRPFSFTKM